MEEITKDLFNFVVLQVQYRRPDYTIEECLVIATEIIKANFPKCVDKWAKGEEWKL